MGGWLAVWAPTEWRRRWPALIALAALVALTGGVATALVAGARRADSSFERFLDVTGAPNLVAEATLGGGDPGLNDVTRERLSAQVEVVDELAALNGVEWVQVESWWAIQLEPDLDQTGQATAFATGTFVSAGEPPTPLVLDGELPGLADADRVVVNEEAERTFGARVGTTMRFRTASPDRLTEWARNDGVFASVDGLDGPEIIVEVAAVVHNEADMAAHPFPSMTFPEGFAQAHRDVIAHVERSVLLRVDPAQLADVRRAVEEVVAPYDMRVTPAPSASSVVDPSIRIEVTTLQVAALVAAVAGALVAATAFGRQASSIGADNAVHAALGVTRTQRARGTGLVLAPSALAGAVGVPVVAWGLSAFFPRGVARLAEPDPGPRFDAATLLIGAVATAAVAVLVLAGSSLLTTSQQRAAHPTRTWSGGWLLGTPVRVLGASFAVDPTGTGRRSRFLVGATVGGIALGVAAVITVATLETSRAHLVTSPRLFGAPAELVLQSNGTFGIAEVVDAALATTGVEALTRHVAINDDTMTAIGPGGPTQVEPEAYETRRGGAIPPIVDGRHPQGFDEVALGAATAEALDARIGDTIHMTPNGGGGELALRVTGMVVSWGTGDPLHAFIVTPDMLDRILCADIPFDECSLSANVFADVTTSEAQAALLEAGFEPVTVPDNVDRLDQTGVVPRYLAAFLCLLAGAGLLHGLLTTLRRRRRDIAITRALGLTGRRAADALAWQAVLTALVGVAAGSVLGAIAGPLAWRLIAADLGVIARPVLPVGAMAVTAVIGVAAAVVLSLGPRWRAVRLSLTVALRSE